MIKSAEYLDKAMKAEAAAKRAASPELRASFADIARVWRNLAGSADEVVRTQFGAQPLAS